MLAFNKAARFLELALSTGAVDDSQSPRVHAEIQQAVDDVNQRVSQVERVKRFVILPDEWTLDGEELTPTLKLKRRVIYQKYGEEIDRLYAPAGG